MLHNRLAIIYKSTKMNDLQDKVPQKELHQGVPLTNVNVVSIREVRFHDFSKGA